MAFISRLIYRRVANLISKFNASPHIVDEIENDYPLEGSGDHYRFFI